MKSIGEIAHAGYWQDGDLVRAFQTLDNDSKRRNQDAARAVLAHAAAIIRERAETETKSWGARDEWLRVALILEKME